MSLARSSFPAVGGPGTAAPPASRTSRRADTKNYVYNSMAWAAALSLGPDSVVMHPRPIVHNAVGTLMLLVVELSGMGWSLPLRSQYPA